MSYLTRTSSGLRLSRYHRSLDGTEKGGFSYRIGMGLAKLAMEDELNVAWLRHVDPLIEEGIVEIDTGSQERGDLVGQDVAGAWHAVEAKARTRPPPATLIGKAKNQAARIVAINKTAPATKTGCVSDLSTHPFNIDLRDPRRPDDESPLTELRVDEIRFFEDYYGLMSTLSAAANGLERRHIQGLPGSPEYSVIELPWIDFAFGVRTEILERRERGQAWREAVAASLPTQKRERDASRQSPKMSVGLDGYAVFANDLLED